MKNLVDKQIWDSRWSKDTNFVINKEFSFDNIISNYLDSILKNERIKTCIEIGAAPGRWLSYIKKRRPDIKITALEYSEIGIEKIKQCFKFHNITDYEIIEGDFLELELNKKFDLIISIGFIEHFEDEVLRRVVSKHFGCLNSDGILFLDIPNFRGINYLLQYFFDKSLLDQHNINLMSKNILKSIIEPFLGKNMKCMIKYEGSFEPALIHINDTDRFRYIKRQMLGGIYLLRKIFNFKMDHKYLSQCIICLVHEGHR